MASTHFHNYVLQFPGGPSAKYLMWVDLPIQSNKNCQDCFLEQLGHGWDVDETMLCAGRIPENEFDACQVNIATQPFWAIFFWYQSLMAMIIHFQVQEQISQFSH